MSPARGFMTVLLFVAIVLGLSSIFVVREGQQAVLLQLGRLITKQDGITAKVYGPGLHFKMPLIAHAKLFDTRLQTLEIGSEGQPYRVVTVEQKDVLVDYYAKWRINNLPLYYIRTNGNEETAKNLLTQKLNNSLRAEFGKRDISEVVSSERVGIMQALQKQAVEGAKDLGIDVLDVRMKRIDLPDGVTQSVFNRMKAARKQVAAKHRADGKAKEEAIKAAADAQVVTIVANAQRQAFTIQGQGEAQVANIYAKAYNQDRAFFEFYRSLEAYKNVFNNKRDLILLRPDSEFFNYFNKTTKSKHGNA